LVAERAVATGRLLVEELGGGKVRVTEPVQVLLYGDPSSTKQLLGVATIPAAFEPQYNGTYPFV
jgi:hypothetical protein